MDLLLQDAIVYLSRIIPEADRQQLSTIILDSLGMLVGQFNKNVTHYLCSRPDHLEELEELTLAQLGPIKRPMVVCYKWLLDSASRGKLLDVASYSVTARKNRRRETFSGPLQLKLGLNKPLFGSQHDSMSISSGRRSTVRYSITDGLSIRPVIRRHKSHTSINVREANSESTRETDADKVAQASSQPALIGSNNFWDDLIYDVNGSYTNLKVAQNSTSASHDSASRPLVQGELLLVEEGNAQKPNPSQKCPKPGSGGEGLLYDEAGLFAKLAFRALGFNKEETGMLRAVVEEHGGKWSPQKFTGTKYLIVPVDKEVYCGESIGEILVTECWLEACLDDRTIVSPFSRLVYRPYVKPDFKKLGLSFGITGFEGIHRDHVRRLVESAGLKFTERFSIKQSFLICAENPSLSSSRKYEMALEWKTPIIRLPYVEDCILSQRILPLEEKYLLINQKPKTDEILPSASVTHNRTFKLHETAAVVGANTVITIQANDTLPSEAIVHNPPQKKRVVGKLMVASCVPIAPNLGSQKASDARQNIDKVKALVDKTLQDSLTGNSGSLLPMTNMRLTGGNEPLKNAELAEHPAFSQLFNPGNENTVGNAASLTQAQEISYDVDDKQTRLKTLLKRLDPS